MTDFNKEEMNHVPETETTENKQPDATPIETTSTASTETAKPAETPAEAAPSQAPVNPQPYTQPNYYQQPQGYPPYGQPMANPYYQQQQNPYSQNIPQQPLLTPSSQNKTVKQKKEHKSHPVLLAVLCALLGTSGGFGGSLIAHKITKSDIQPTSTVVVHESVSADSTLPTASTNSGELSIRDIAAKASPSVVEIKVEVEVTSMGFFGQNTYTSQAAGSGVIISDDGYIVTNNHVIEGAKTCTVKLVDGTEYEATLVGTDAKSDIGVIKIEATGLTPATIGDSSAIQVGDTAVAIGNPLGTLGGTVTSGIISATNRQVTISNEAMNLIQTNAEINSGNSGGGLFDGHGNLIGIVNAKDSGVISNGSTIEGLGFAIPVNDAMDIVEQLMTYGEVTNRATLGVTVQTLSQDTNGYTAGLYIAEIAQNSGAQSGGLQVGDRIVEVDGTSISSYTDLSYVLKSHKPGDTVNIVIERNGAQETHEVTLTGPVNTAPVEEEADQ